MATQIVWSKDLAYVVGLITTDGSLSKDGRHIDFTSKDLDQIRTFKKILKLKNKIGKKYSGENGHKFYPRIQFGNVKLYRFLVNLGLHPNKSKTLGSLNVPDKFFADFLRGYFDGDGHSYSYWDKRWKSSFMLYLGFSSASKKNLYWIKEKISNLYNIEGAIKHGRSVYQLMYAKRSSLKLIKILYYRSSINYLKRKKFKIEKALGIINSRPG